MSFPALLLSKEKEDEKQQRLDAVELQESDLMEGDATIAVAWSTLNYKDALALTGKAPVVRRWPMIPGIDFAGAVESCAADSLSPGEQVVVNGWGCGEVHYGGYAGKARVPHEWPIRLPEGISAKTAMEIGTAGYTAMLCVLALEKQGVAPDGGEILVTGASGGVGGIAILLLSRLGYEVVASTGRTEESEYLHSLGAKEVIDRKELSEPGRPLGKERWGGVVDSVGSHTLANAIAQTRYGGAVAACGLAQGMDLPASVAPFILRGVRLIGVDSVKASRERREIAWRRLAQDLDLAKLAGMTQTVKLQDGQALQELARELLAGKVRGRVLVEIAP